MTSLRSIIFGEGYEDHGGSISTTLREARLLTELPDTRVSASPDAVRRLVTQKVDSFLDVDVKDVLTWAWHARQNLIRAAHETSGRPGQARDVSLVALPIEWTYEPTLVVLVSKVQVARIPCNLSVRVDIGAIVATVENGRLTRLGAGKCWVEVGLAVAHAHLVGGRRELDVSVEMRLPAAGLALIHDGP